MAYSDFTLDGLITQFHPQVREERDYFAACVPCLISDLLRQTLQDNVPLALDIKGWRLRGEIALAQRQGDEAEQWLRQALPLARQIGNPTQLWKTHLSLGQLHTAARRPRADRAGLSCCL